MCPLWLCLLLAKTLVVMLAVVKAKRRERGREGRTEGVVEEGEGRKENEGREGGRKK